MTNEIVAITIGGMLHDIGKIAHRAGARNSSHSASGAEFLRGFDAFNNTGIPQMAALHHADHLKSANIEKKSPAHIVYIADNISAGSDRRSDEGEQGGNRRFEPMLPLASVFNILNENHGHSGYKADFLREDVNYPHANAPEYTVEYYCNILVCLKKGLQAIEICPGRVNSLLALLESTLSFVPSSTCTGELADISLFDHSKTTAAIAACIKLYLDAHGLDDYRTELLVQEKQFYDKQVFLLYSFDLSGIQGFIYTVGGKGALKNLRARSFYLEMLAEHIADELLDAAGVSRANLLYVGGGHAYLLLPNTPETKVALVDKEKFINDWLLREFKTSLFCAFGHVACSGNDLMNKPDERSPYPELYRCLAEKLSARKRSRYSAETIAKLNFIPEPMHQDERECSECRRTDDLIDVNGQQVCPLCAALYRISGRLVKPEVFFAVSQKGDLPLPGAFLSVVDDENSLRAMLNRDEVKRFYSKNSLYTGQNMATNLWMGDYIFDGDFNELSKSGPGIERIAVLRADVDNLGKAFTHGFGHGYNTLSRTATLSRQLSLFFKFHINKLLRDKKRKATIIYSGGDDLFIAGHWKDCVDMARDIREALTKFTCAALKISGGIGIYAPSYPIKRMAAEVGLLEDAAKKRDETKDRIALFSDRFVFTWEQFSSKVLGEKYGLIKKFFDSPGARDDRSESTERGTAFLYRILELLRAADEPINIARLAYMLARLEPGKTAPVEQAERYKALAAGVCQWAMDRNARVELECALMLYVYETRGKEE